MVKRQQENPDTRSAILDVAERLVQRRGFNGFSYGDVASELGITRAALHYHFPEKSELGESLISRYAGRFLEMLSLIDGCEMPSLQKLESYCDLYGLALRDERMCLCGMLAAEYQTLPDLMRERVHGFFEDNRRWLATLLEIGREEGSLAVAASPQEAAQMIIATLEGAMLVARAYGNTDLFDSVVASLLTDFRAPDHRVPPRRRRSAQRTKP